MPDGHVNQCKECTKARRYGVRDWIRMRYGITPEQYDAMVANQDGRCAICLVPQKKFCLDHCHKTNRIRGMLCNTCNVAIAYMGDNPSNLMRAIEYLKEPSDSSSVVFVNRDRLRKRAKNKKTLEKERLIIVQEN